MLTCRQATAQASDHLDGHLSLRARLSLRMHLLMCVHCRRFWRQFRTLVGSLQFRDRAIPVPDSFIEDVLRRLDETGFEPPDQNPDIA